MIRAGVRCGLFRQLVLLLTVASWSTAPWITDAAAVSAPEWRLNGVAVSVDRSATWGRPSQLSSRTSHLACKCPVGFYSGGGITILAPSDMCNSSSVTAWTGQHPGVNTFRVNMTTCHGCAQGCAVCSGPEEHECSRCGPGFLVNYHHEIILAQTEEYSEARLRSERSVRGPVELQPSGNNEVTTTTSSTAAVTDSVSSWQLSTRAMEEDGLLMRMKQPWNKKFERRRRRKFASRSLRDDEESSGYVTELEVVATPVGVVTRKGYVKNAYSRGDSDLEKEKNEESKPEKQKMDDVPSLVSDVITVEREKRKHVGEMVQRDLSGGSEGRAEDQKENAQQLTKNVEDGVGTIASESITERIQSRNTESEFKPTGINVAQSESGSKTTVNDTKSTESDTKTTVSDSKQTGIDSERAGSDESEEDIDSDEDVDEVVPVGGSTGATSGSTTEKQIPEEAPDSAFSASPWAFSCVARCPHGFYANSRRICRPCDRECDGCYGDGPERCITCRHFKMASRCVWSCGMGVGGGGSSCVGGGMDGVDVNVTVSQVGASGEGGEEDEESSTPAIYYAVPPLVIAVVALCLFVSFYRRRRKLRRSILWRTEGMSKRERGGSDCKAYYAPYLKGDKMGLAEFKNSVDAAKRPGNAYVYADRPLLHQKGEPDGIKNSHSWSSLRAEEDPLYETPENTWKGAPGHSRTHPRVSNGSVAKADSYLVPFSTDKGVSKSLDDCRTHSTKATVAPLKLQEFRRASEDASSRGKRGESDSEQNLSEYTQYLEVPFFEAPPLPVRNSPSVDIDDTEDHIYANIDDDD